jgi:DNA-binding LytR/AlgR family response regulator
VLEIAICDDDPSITGFLETTIRETGTGLPEPLHIRVFNRGAAVLAAMDAGDAGNVPFDIIFLDIELGDTTGIAVAEQIRTRFEDPVLIFVSAHESYCKDLFQFDTTAFLPKPIDKAAVKKVLLRAYTTLRNPKAVFTYRDNDAIYRIPLSAILYFESRARKIEMVTKAGSREPRAFYGKLTDVETQLKHPGFIRIHYSMLVNLDNVERLEKNTLLFPGGRVLTVAKTRQKEVRRKIMDYFRGMP